MTTGRKDADLVVPDQAPVLPAAGERRLRRLATRLFRSVEEAQAAVQLGLRHVSCSVCGKTHSVGASAWRACVRALRMQSRLVPSVAGGAFPIPPFSGRRPFWLSPERGAEWERCVQEMYEVTLACRSVYDYPLGPWALAVPVEALLAHNAAWQDSMRARLARALVEKRREWQDAYAGCLSRLAGLMVPDEFPVVAEHRAMSEGIYDVAFRWKREGALVRGMPEYQRSRLVSWDIREDLFLPFSFACGREGYKALQSWLFSLVETAEGADWRDGYWVNWNLHALCVAPSHLRAAFRVAYVPAESLGAVRPPERRAREYVSGVFLSWHAGDGLPRVGAVMRSSSRGKLLGTTVPEIQVFAGSGGPLFLELSAFFERLFAEGRVGRLPLAFWNPVPAAFRPTAGRSEIRPPGLEGGDGNER